MPGGAGAAQAADLASSFKLSFRWLRLRFYIQVEDALLHPIHIGGLTPAMAKIAEGIVQIPSPAMSPEATAAESREQSAGLIHCQMSMMTATGSEGGG